VAALVDVSGGHVTLPAGTGVTKPASVFAGWNTLATGAGTSYAAGASYTITGVNVTLFAKWTPTYSVTFNANGGAGAVAALADVSGARITLPSTGFTKAPFVIAGWNTLATGAGTSYAAGASYTIGGANVTLYAVWGYSVIYVANAPVGRTATGTVPSPVAYSPGSSVTVSANTGSLTVEGYTLNGWNTAANGTGTLYAATGSATFNILNSVTLYAQWRLITFNVIYHPNEITATGSTPATVAYTPSSSVKVAGNVGVPPLTVPGYTFNGWNTAANGSGTSYATDALFIMGNTDVNLYARWSINTYTVSYNSNGATSGTVPTDTSNPHNYQASAIVARNTGALAKTGYGFTGWNTAPSGVGGTFYAPRDTILNITANITLYAQWATVYAVTYNGNGSTDIMTDPNSPYIIGSSVPLLANTFTRTGYKFTGWTTGTNGAGTSYVNAATIQSLGANTTLYAQWVIAYTVSYNANPPTVDNVVTGIVPTDPTFYTGGSRVTVSGNQLACTGYTFGGWTDEAGTSYASSVSFTITGNTNLKAKWTINTFRVTYNANIPTGYNATNSIAPVDPTTHNYNTTVGLLGPGSIAVPGLTAIRWNTAANGSGTPYNFNDTISNINANISLYVMWGYTIMYSDQNAPSDSNSPYPLGATATILAPSSRPNYYTFNGWLDGTINYPTGSRHVFTVNTILVAKWTGNTVTVGLNECRNYAAFNTAVANDDLRVPSFRDTPTYYTPASAITPSTVSVTIPNAIPNSSINILFTCHSVTNSDNMKYRLNVIFVGWTSEPATNGSTGQPTLVTNPTTNVTLYRVFALERATDYTYWQYGYQRILYYS
jgi:uncharacterized repeat protein (TIGR02543 family)